MPTLKHTFLTKAHDIVGLFRDTTKLATFCSKLEKQAQKDPDRYPVQDYLGNGFEFFVELLLKLHPCDNRLGVYDYSPNQGLDHGVDGTGLNIRLEPCVVQIKYRSDNSTLLTATEDHLSNLFSSGDAHYRVTTDHTNSKNFRHYVFTTAKGLHFYTDQEMYAGRVKCFGYEKLRGLVDNNLIFWKKALELIEQELAARKTAP